MQAYLVKQPHLEPLSNQRSVDLELCERERRGERESERERRGEREEGRERGGEREGGGRERERGREFSEKNEE